MRRAAAIIAVVLLVGTAGSSSAWHPWRVARIVPWYGPGFYGNRTACGQVMSKQLRGVAHRTLPCGTRIRLRYRGIRLTVRVVDRGPYPARHLYDDMPLDLTARTNCWDLNGGTYQSPCPSRRDVRWRVIH